MQTSDARMIVDLADSIRNAGPIQKDQEAAQLITQLIASQPDAVYFLVQTVLLQKEALAAQQSAAPGGAPYAAPAAAAPAPAPAEEPRGRWGGLFGSRRPAPEGSAGGGGSSFLKSAAAGAAGVAGGVLLAQGISGMFSGGHEDHASAEPDSDWDDEGWDEI